MAYTTDPALQMKYPPMMTAGKVIQPAATSTTATGTAATAAKPARPPGVPANFVMLPGGQWVPPDYPGAQAAAGASGGTQAPQTIAGAFQSALLSKLNAGPVSASDPQIAGAIRANRDAEYRGMQRSRSLLAERAAAQGLDPNAFNTQLLGAQQESAGRQSAFEGQAVQRLGEQQAAQLMQAIQIAQQQGNQEEERRLRLQLAQMQQKLGIDDITLRRQLGMGQLGLGLAGLQQSGQQFQQGLGAQLGMFGANLNQQALLAALGAL